MSYITQFGGYTPEDDLSDADWALLFDLDATATVLGISSTYLGKDYSNDSSDTYTFSGIIPGIGVYVIGVYGYGNTDGFANVEVDGLLADEIVSNSSESQNIALFVVDPASMLDGDIVVTANTALDNCAVIVWQLLGISNLTPDDTGNSAMAVYESVSVDTLAAIFGIAGSDTPQVDNHFWFGLAEDIDFDVDITARVSGASVRKTFSDTTLQIGAERSETTTSDRWLAAVYNTPVTYFSSGQCVALEKQISDDHTVWRWTQVTAVADVEVLALLRPTAESDTFMYGIAARAQGSSGAETAVFAVLTESVTGAKDQVALYKIVGGYLTQLNTASFDWDVDANYWLKLQVDGSSLKVRVWAQTDTEPTTWDIEETDSDVSDAGYVGLYHQFIDSECEIGYFSAKVLWSAWPSTVPFNWTVEMSGGPQPNKITFQPEVGPTIDRRRSSSVNRIYTVDVPGLSHTEYHDFVDFYKTTLQEGTLPFRAVDPFSGLEKTFKFTNSNPSYSESFQSPPGASYDAGIIKVSFEIMRLD